MSRDWRLYLADMSLCCEKIATFVGDLARDEFLSNTLVYDAVLRNLEILGEAAKHIPADVRIRMTDVPWREIAGMRDWLAHGYFKVDADVVWNAIRVELPLLSRSLRGFEDRNVED